MSDSTIAIDAGEAPAQPGLPSPQRRRPVQDRSQDKVARILATTAALVDRFPADSITMIQLAEASGTSFSTIYRFFPSKEAIFEAVAIRYIETFESLCDQLLETAEPAKGAALVDELVDGYHAFMVAEPGFKALWVDAMPTQAVVARFRQMNRTIVRRCVAFYVDRLGGTTSPDFELRLTLAIEATTQLTKFALQQPVGAQARVIGEVKYLLKKYLF